VRCEVAPEFFIDDYDRDIFVEVHMDYLHGAGAEHAIATLKEKLKTTVQFKVWEARGPGSTYERLKRICTLRDGLTRIVRIPKYLQAVFQLAGLVGRKPALTTSIAGHVKIADGEVSEAFGRRAGQSVSHGGWHLAVHGRGQAPRAVRGERAREADGESGGEVANAS
jgi:hypothetical protein